MSTMPATASPRSHDGWYERATPTPGSQRSHVRPGAAGIGAAPRLPPSACCTSRNLRAGVDRPDVAVPSPHGRSHPGHLRLRRSRPAGPFWAEVLGYQLDPPPPGYDSWEAWLTEQGIPESDWNMASAVSDPDGRGPRIFFQRVPEPKQVKNRVHLDVNAGGPRGTPDDERRRAWTPRSQSRFGGRHEGPAGRGARRAALRHAGPRGQRILPPVARPVPLGQQAGRGFWLMATGLLRWTVDAWPRPDRRARASDRP